MGLHAAPCPSLINDTLNDTLTTTKFINHVCPLTPRHCSAAVATRDPESVMEDTLRMYIAINHDTKMGKGKIAAQAGHAVSAVTERCLMRQPALWRRYAASGHRKIVVKASQAQMEELERAGGTPVRDAGHTQVEPGTLTAVAFAPASAPPVPLLAALKLL